MIDNNLIVRLLTSIVIAIWFIFIVSGWMIPIILQRSGYNTVIQRVSWLLWFTTTIVGLGLFMKNIGTVC